MNLKRSLFLYLDEQDGNWLQESSLWLYRKPCFSWLKRFGDYLTSSNTAHRRDLLPVKNTMILLESWLNESKIKVFLCKLWSHLSFWKPAFPGFLASVRHLWMTHSPALNFPPDALPCGLPAPGAHTALGFILLWFLLAFFPHFKIPHFKSVYTCLWRYWANRLIET